MDAYRGQGGERAASWAQSPTPLPLASPEGEMQTQPAEQGPPRSLEEGTRRVPEMRGKGSQGEGAQKGLRTVSCVQGQTCVRSGRHQNQLLPS